MNKVVKNFCSVSLANIIGQLIGFISIAYYSAILGDKLYGIITYAQQWILYFTTIVLFGVQTFGTKLVVKKEKEYSELVSELFTFRFIISIVSVLLCVAFAFIFKNNNTWFFVLIIWNLILIPTSLNFDWFFSGIQDMVHNAVYNLFKNVFPAIIIFLFFKTKEDIMIIPIAMVLGVVCGATYFLIILKKKKINVRFIWKTESIKRYFVLGLPFLLSALLSMINGNIDKIILGAYGKYSELGTYQAAYTIINFIVNFIGVTFLPLFPILVDAYYNNKEKLNGVFKIISKIIVGFFFPVAVGGFLLADEIIEICYRGNFELASVPLKILMVYIFILCIREIYAYSLNAFGMEKSYFKIVLISASLNFVLNLILIPIFGYIAAAIITTLTEVINLVLMRKKIKRKVQINDFLIFAKAIIPCIFMAIGIVFIKKLIGSIFVIIPIAIIIYFATMFLFKIITVSELKENLKG